MIDFLVVTLLLILIAISSAVVFLLIRSKNDKEGNSIKDTLGEYEKTQLEQGESLKRQEDSLTKLTTDIQSFQEPLSKLRNYLSGGTRAGQFGEWSLEAIIKDIFSESQFSKNVEILVVRDRYTSCLVDF